MELPSDMLLVGLQEAVQPGQLSLTGGRQKRHEEAPVKLRTPVETVELHSDMLSVRLQVNRFMWSGRGQHSRAMPRWQVDSTMVDRFLWGCRRWHSQDMPRWEVNSTRVDQFL